MFFPVTKGMRLIVDKMVRNFMIVSRTPERCGMGEESEHGI